MSKKLSLLLFLVLASFVLFGGTLVRSRNAASQPAAPGVPSPSPAAVRAESAEVSTAETPVTLSIPKLGVETSVEPVGQDSEGRMDVPKDVRNVSWYQLGVKPGEMGSAVLAGHYDNPDGSPSVFYSIGSLKAGDEILVTNGSNQTHSFTVEEIRSFKDASFPSNLVFLQNDAKRLNLITCSGVWNKVEKNYSDRLVVFAKLKE